MTYPVLSFPAHRGWPWINTQHLLLGTGSRSLHLRSCGKEISLVKCISLFQTGFGASTSALKGGKGLTSCLNCEVQRSGKGLCPASVPLRSPNNGPNVTSAQTGARECFSEGLNADGFLNHNGEEHASDTIWILNLISDFYFIASKVKLRKQHVQSSC